MNAIYVHVLSKRLTVLLCIELHYIIIIIILVETFIFFAIVMYGLLHKVAGFIFVLFFLCLNVFSIFIYCEYFEMVPILANNIFSYFWKLFRFLKIKFDIIVLLAPIWHTKKKLKANIILSPRFFFKFEKNHIFAFLKKQLSRVLYSIWEKS